MQESLHDMSAGKAHEMQLSIWVNLHPPDHVIASIKRAHGAWPVRHSSRVSGPSLRNSLAGGTMKTGTSLVSQWNLSNTACDRHRPGLQRCERSRFRRAAGQGGPCAPGRGPRAPPRPALPRQRLLPSRARHDRRAQARLPHHCSSIKVSG